VDARRVPHVQMGQTSMIRGDSRSHSIAAASIVAKVERDVFMERLGLKYPGYGFEKHRGYGTADHLAALEALGPVPVHRRSFSPVAEAEARHRGAGGEV
ncbi:MAG: ribonuclease HII, partial [Myxococcota bacterium]|nr:ribonuclease HII [Myxococcota bacterium]